MHSVNSGIGENGQIVLGFYPAVPSSSTPAYVSLKGYARCTILVVASNTTGVTGSAITVKQATNVSAGSEKALGLTEYYYNADTSASNVLVRTTASSDTFTTNTTQNKVSLYVIDVNADSLDSSLGFDCIRAGTGDSTNATIGVYYILYPANVGISTNSKVD